jgi:hypothetical protein
LLAEWLRRAAAAAQAPLGYCASCVRAGAAAHGCFLAGRLLEMLGTSDEAITRATA